MSETTDERGPTGTPLGRLHQIQVRFEPVPDRLLLRVNTSERAELRWWFTRRLTARLLPALATALTDAEVAVGAASAPARRAAAAMRREEVVTKADFAAPFAETPEAKPLGEEPILVARVRLERRGANHAIHLEPQSGRGFHLNLDRPTLHAFCELIQRAVDKAEWRLDADPISAAADSEPSGAALN